MSLFFRAPRPEERAVTELPWNHGGTLTGGNTLDGQLALVPVYAAVRLIADSIASLPMQAYRKTGDSRQQITLPAMFSAAHGGSRISWTQEALTSLLLRGNAYGLRSGHDGSLDPLGAPVPKSVQWLHPDQVTYQNGVWRWQGREVPESDMLHIPGLVVPGSRLGLSPIGACAAAVSSGLETQAFMRDWYRNKARPGMLARNTEQTLTAEQATTAKERIKGSIRAGDPLVTGKDWEITGLTMSADDAGFVAASRLTATQVATIFGIPPEMIGGEAGHSLTYATVEMNQIQFLTNTLRPWVSRLEEAFSSLLPRPHYVKFNVNALIRVDTKTRHDVYKVDREIGLRNVDELRALEDEEPLPNGAGTDYTPLSQMGPARSKEAR